MNDQSEADIDIEAIEKAGKRILRAIGACEKKYGGGVTVMALRGVVCSHFMALAGTGICPDSEIPPIFDEFAEAVRGDIEGMLEMGGEALH